MATLIMILGGALSLALRNTLDNTRWRPCIVSITGGVLLGINFVS